MMNKTIGYCPLGGGLCHHAALGRCGLDFPNMIMCRLYWENEMRRARDPSLPQPPPIELEEDQYCPPGGPPGRLIAPLPLDLPDGGYPIPVEGNARCLLMEKKIGDKAAGSCDGCKIAGCAAKGRVE